MDNASEPRSQILCIGSVLWDIVGHAPDPMRPGNDKPGRIRRLPGGVAMNVAMATARFGFSPVLLSVIGADPEGDELIAACAGMGLQTAHVFRPEGLPTDRYMAIETPSGLVAAIADARSLEAAGEAILAPLEDGRLGSEAAPYAGLVALDGNLTEALLADLAARPSFAAADLRVAPASPGKATRLRPLLGHPGATFYVNLEEAGLILGTAFSSAAHAAEALLAAGLHQALVTHGAGPAAAASADGVVTATPPKVRVARITGAGDMFMAAHIAAQSRGAEGAEALQSALDAAAAYVSAEENS